MYLYSGGKTVSIKNDFNLEYERATDYDWNRGGGFERGTLIDRKRRRFGLGDNHGFRVFYYVAVKLKH